MFSHVFNIKHCDSFFDTVSVFFIFREIPFRELALTDKIKTSSKYYRYTYCACIFKQTKTITVTFKIQQTLMDADVLTEVFENGEIKLSF